MTVRVAGLWELGWNTPIKEVELWEFPVRDFGVERFYMTPVSGIRPDIIIQERHSMEEILAENEDLTVVHIDERGKEPLHSFVHPENALYVFGKVSLSAMVAYGRPGDRSVKISTPLNLGVLWPHQCLSLVLYDRFLKAQG